MSRGKPEAHRRACRTPAARSLPSGRSWTSSSRLVLLRLPALDRGRASLDGHELVGARVHPRPGLAVGPLDADPGGVVLTEPGVDPAELSAGVATADGDLTLDGAIAGLHLHPRADGVP